jgi:DNA replication and repair protein RecF
MRLASVDLENFRNYSKVSISTDADLVLILGSNAAGKTNFLESIYFLSVLKSFRAPDQLLVRYQESHFGLKGQVGENKLEVIVQTSPALKRQYKINGQKTKRAFWQPFPVVLFVPNDLNLFNLGPILRRKFLDETLSQINLAYGADLFLLDHILKQKSALLERVFQNQAQPEEIDSWNQQLAPIAVRITEHRQKFVDFLNANLPAKISQLMGSDSAFLLQYKRMEPKTEQELLESLASHKQAEIRSGKNLIGPHKDDFILEKDGQLNLYNSSRGELRTQILALKLLQAEFLGQTKMRPVILLDDVFSELDELRRTKLLENLSGHQIFITSTEGHHLPKLTKDTLVLNVENNEIKTT